jgi:hypothetical protein
MPSDLRHRQAGPRQISHRLYILANSFCHSTKPEVGDGGESHIADRKAVSKAAIEAATSLFRIASIRSSSCRAATRLQFSANCLSCSAFAIS